MLISELSEKTGVSVRSLRHYEQKGLISSTRLENRYRFYDDQVIKPIETIQFYLSLGFTTDQISEFLSCVLKHQEAFCTEVKPLYQRKISELNGQLKNLKALKKKLEDRFNQIEFSEEV